MESVNRYSNNPDIPELDRYRDEVRGAINQFMSDNDIQFVIGLSGGASESTPEKQRQTTEFITDFITSIGDLPCSILTGGTSGGVPELGIRIARASSIPTIGVFPEQGRKYALHSELDLAIETIPPLVGDGLFGTETPTFVNMLDGAAVIGGGTGTLIEIATILKTNSKLIRLERDPIYLCPINGSGGAADMTYALPDIDAAVLSSLPGSPIVNGAQAAEFLKTKLLARNSNI